MCLELREQAFTCFHVFCANLTMTVQVHEKSLMIALLPASLLGFEEPVLAGWLPVWSTLGMFPLLKKDGLGLAYVACLVLWLAVAPAPYSLASWGGDKFKMANGHVWCIVQYCCCGSVLLAVSIHSAQCIAAPPDKFPFLYDYSYMSLAFTGVFGAALYSNCRQWLC